MVKLSIIIPAYNEERTIENTTNQYIEFFDKKMKRDYEIIIVPNGCRDKTVEIVKKLSKKYKQVRYFDLGLLGEKGKAVIKGFELANGDLIGFVDADLSTSPKAFYNLVVNLKDNYGIIASRWMRGSKVNVKQPLLRRMLSRTFNFFVRLILGLRYIDTQCGSKLFKKEAIKQIYNKLNITRWAFDVNLLYLMKLNGFKVIEVPTEWNETRKKSKLNIKSAVPEMFLSLIRLRLAYSKFKFIVDLSDRLYENLILGERR